MDEPELSGASKRGKNRKFERRDRPAPKPLGSARLNDMALAYVARFATSAAKLEAYLKRKLRERGWSGEDAAEGLAVAEALVERFVAAGYVDDESFARAKAGSLLRRGFGGRRIAQTLGHDGIDEGLRAQVAPDEAEARSAAVALARKRRFGPFAREGAGAPAVGDPKLREKQMAAMLRAGHGMDVARYVLAASDPDALEEWVDEARDAAG
jgi:regulatory protein